MDQTQDVKRLNKEKIERAAKSPLAFFIERWRVSILIIIGIVLWGTISVLSLPREANPEVKIPYGVVSTVFSGASPKDVEELVTDKIEDKIQNVDNIRRITSSSSFSISTVFVEFEADADLDKSIQDLKDAVGEVVGLPADAEDPMVSDVSFSDQPIVTFSMSGDLSDEELKAIGERAQDELENISDVSSVDLIGARQREITVALIPGALERLGMPVSQVLGALQSGNANLPIGTVEFDGVKYNVRSEGVFVSADDVANLVVRSGPSGTVLLSDVAAVRNELKEKTSISRVSVAGGESLPAISLQVHKRTGGNIIEIVDAAKGRLDELKQEGIIPQNLKIETTSDLSVFIRQDFNTLTNSAFQTMIIILVLLTLALSFRKALVAMICLPIVFLLTFGVLAWTGSTLNSLVLFSLVLSMGLLIDTFIVLLEGIHDGLLQGMSPREAALYSIETYKWPVISGVLTTIAAFLPMFLVSGIMGEFLQTLPITISSTLGSSLFIGLVIMPGIAALVLSRGKQEWVKEEKTIIERRITDPLARWYSIKIRSLLSSRKKKWRFVLSLTGAFVVAMGLVIGGVIPVSLFPSVDVESFYVNIEMPSGSVLENTDAVTKNVEDILSQVPEINTYVTNVGVALSTFDGGGGGGGSDSSQIVVNLVDEKDRELKSFEVADKIRTKTAGISEAEVTVSELTAGPPTGAPVEIRITGDDIVALEQTSDEVKSFLKGIEGVRDVETDVRQSPPEFVFQLNHDLLGRYGLNAISVASAIRTTISGSTAGSITVAGDDLDIRVQSGKDPLNIDELRSLTVVSHSGQVVRMDQLGTFNIEPASESIRHRDLQRIVNVRAQLQGPSIADVQQEFEKAKDTLRVSEGIQLNFGGEVEDINQSFTELWYSMSVAVVLILFIMVLQFNSFKQPFIILLTLPLAVIGVVVGTLLLGLEFGFATFLGIVALSGIVVNDAIILIDRINYNVKVRKLELAEAVSEAGEARLEPIMITTLTTIAGVLPLAFADEFWRGLSIAVAFGIAFATVLTLGLVPMLYLKWESKSWVKQRKLQN